MVGITKKSKRDHDFCSSFYAFKRKSKAKVTYRYNVLLAHAKDIFFRKNRTVKFLFRSNSLLEKENPGTEFSFEDLASIFISSQFHFNAF